MWAVDLITYLPTTPIGNKYVIAVISYFTKWVEAKHHTQIDSHEVSRFIPESIICRHSMPVTIHTDWGGEFLGEMDLYLHRLEVEHCSIATQNPCTNILVE